MAEAGEPETMESHAESAGAMLARARAAKGLDLAAVASQTRIPQRHLLAIEAGNYAALPSRTYAIGFSRTYARLLGLDERQITEQVRRDLDEGIERGGTRPDRFEPGDPARVPSRKLAWFSLLGVVVLIVGAFSFYRTYFSPGLGPPPLTAPTPAATVARPVATTAPATSAVPSGPVVFTSLADGTWIKFYDSTGKRLFEGQLAKGQAYTVPADAVSPKAWTGRPDLFAITVGGQPVAALGPGETVVKDVAVDAASLTARPVAPATPVAATSAPTPAAT